jgi:hypothetical protein
MVRAALTALVPANHKPTPASAVLEPYAEEIKELITRRSDPLKAKSAWVVISTRHELGDKVSYETFKRFVRALARAQERPFPPPINGCRSVRSCRPTRGRRW